MCIKGNWNVLAIVIAIPTVFALTGCKDGGNITESDSEACGGPGILCNVSGVAGDLGGGGNGGPALEANHYWPMDVAVGPQNKIHVVDWNNHAVRSIYPDGTIERVIGSGNLGDTIGPAEQINLNHPTSLTVGPDGMLYLAAWHNWKIKRINPQTMETTVAAGTLQGFAGDGGSALEARMDLPSSTVFGPDGSMYISDQGNMRIRKVDPQGMITTFAGGERGFADGIGTEARFDAPKGPDAGPGGKLTINPDMTALYVADTNNNRIRRIDLATGEVTTFAGTGEAGYSGDGGAALQAQLNAPTDVYMTHDNDLLIADSQNHVIRKIDASGTISTLVGTGVPGVSPDGTPMESAQLNRPMGLIFDEAAHTLYIADTFNHQVKRVELGHE